MRIFFFLTHDVYPITVGGMELFDHHFIAKLSTKHKVGVASRTIPTNVIENENFEWFPIKKYWPNLIFKPIQYLFLAVKKRKKYDVFILPFATKGGWYLWYHYILFLPISLFLRKRFIIVIHSGIEKGCKPFLIYKIIFKYSTLVGVGNKLSKFYQSFYKTQVNYIPSVIPLVKSKGNKEELRKALNISQTDIIMLYVGSFRRLKNVGLIINALKNVGHSYLNEKSIKLICIGDGETRKEDEKDVEINGLAINVSFLGNRSKEDVAAYYKLSDVFICASSYESLGQVLIEALYNDLPIIASEALAQNAFLNPKNALLFKPNDSDSLAQKINYFVEYIYTRKIIMEQGNNTYNKYFDYNEMIQAYEKLFDIVCKK